MEKQTKDTHAEEEGSEQTQAWALPFVPDSTTSLTNRARIPKAPEQERPIRVGGKRYVEKGSLTEAELLAAKQRVKSSIKRKKQVTEEDKKEERRISNRLSAFQSRNRRLGIIQDLQKTVATITYANADQQRELNNLRRQLAEVRSENEALRRRHEAALARNRSKTSAGHSVGRSSTALSSNEARTLLSNLRGQRGVTPQIYRFLASAVSTGKTTPEILSLMRELEHIQRQQAILRPSPPVQPYASGGQFQNILQQQDPQRIQSLLQPFGMQSHVPQLQPQQQADQQQPQPQRQEQNSFEPQQRGNQEQLASLLQQSFAHIMQQQQGRNPGNQNG